MTIFDAAFQGIIQGLTEFLPVSSSGHLTIYQHISGVNENNLFFSVMLHIGTLSAVVAVYFRLIIKLFASLISIIKKIFKGKFRFRELTQEENMAMMIIIGLIPLFLLFLPIPGTGMKIKDLADKFAHDGYFIIVGLALIGTSLLLFFGGKKRQPVVKVVNGKRLRRKPRTRYTVIDAVIVGITQCFAAIFPGLSRSGSTLGASQLRGINKQTALDYSFLLGTPAIVAAAALEIKDVVTEDGTGDIDFMCILVGMVFAAVVGFIAIKLFKWLLKTDRMYIFIAYTAIVGMCIILVSIVELSKGTNLFTQNPLSF